MRGATALIAIGFATGCSKTEPVMSAPVLPPETSLAPARRVAGAPATAEDLLHRVPMRVAVSSVVANEAFSPFDLVDGDVTTAWNSRTGDARPWIAFRVPPSTRVERVRMTVGFTAIAGKGAEGDYFTMNRRIRKVRVWQDKVSLREVTLDPESRDLQDVPIDGNGGDYRIEIVDTIPGSRKDWREVCVSELQVIGVPPPGMKPHDDLEVLVGALDGTPVTDGTLKLTALPSYASIADVCVKDAPRGERPCDSHEVGCVPAGQPSCDASALSHLPPALPASWPPGWKTARWISGRHLRDHTARCALAIELPTGKVAILDSLGDDCGRPRDNLDEPRKTVFEATTQGRWLVLATAKEGRVDPTAPPFGGDTGGAQVPAVEELRVCGNNRDGEPACTAPLQIGMVDQIDDTIGGPGADGLVLRDEIEWRLRYELVGDLLTLYRDIGTPDAPAAEALGHHLLRR
jgi:hypothetical protein